MTVVASKKPLDTSAGAGYAGGKGAEMSAIPAPTLGATPMPRGTHEDLVRQWKINLAATTAGKVEHLTFDTIHGKPHYGARAFLINRLLECWLARIQNEPEIPLPTLEEVRNA